MPRVTITVPEKNAQPYRFQLDRKTVSLGRGSDNDIAIDCGSVSVKHAEMRRVDGGYELWDLGSTNGIKLNGERSEMIRLRSGMTTKLGDVAFDFLLTEEEQEALSREKPYEESPIVREPEEEAVKPLPAKDVDSKPQTVAASESSGGGFGMIVLLIILAAAAFFVGMAVRFQKETGASLIDAIKSKHSNTSVPPVPVQSK